MNLKDLALTDNALNVEKLGLPMRVTPLGDSASVVKSYLASTGRVSDLWLLRSNMEILLPTGLMTVLPSGVKSKLPCVRS